MDYPTFNLAGNSTQLLSLPKKRAGDFEPEGEHVAKRTMRNAPYAETQAFAVAEPAQEETAAFAIADPAPEGTDVIATLDNMFAIHKDDFSEDDFTHVNGFDVPQQPQQPQQPRQSRQAAFDFCNLAFADATENDAFEFDADALPSAGISSYALGLDFSF